MSVTVRDVARLAGVSTATVSRALRGFPTVGEDIRAQVLDAADRLGYVGSHAAAALSTGRTGCVGVITPFVNRLAFQRMLAGVEHELRAERVDLMLHCTGDPSDPHPVPPHKRLARRVDGFIVLSLSAESPDLAEILKLPLPTVMFGPQAPGVAGVETDDRGGAASATQLLADRGHRRIGVIYGREWDNPSVLEYQRRQGVEDVLERLGLPLPEERRRPGGFIMRGGHRAMLELLDRPEPPTGVFAFSDEMAYGAVQALRERGLTPGRDVALIGYDGHEMSDIVGLSTMHVPFEQIGAALARQMLAALGLGGPAEAHIIVPPVLIERASTRPDAAL
ncbi:MAG: LacI family DNA-binding transcriptional regulator [Propioniciclava sp.]|uniref:LacI family DNA-binding transcriptional regulator n=1 Tax=Propioniciclava sp. TaxID=2038686 RepID=UPI0039E42757